MKGQKGSALLTVIFIVAITSTIGAAVSSMIVYNFRLRSLDIAIQRAEYNAVDIMDYLVFATKSDINQNIETWRNEVKSTIETEATNEKSDYELLSEEEKYNYVTGNSCIYLNLSGEKSKSVEQETHSNFDIYLTDKFNAWIDGWIDGWETKITSLEYEVFDSEDLFDEDEKPDIKLEIGIITKASYDVVNSSNSNKIVVPVTMYYHNANSPVVRIKTNFEILVPTYSSAANSSLYNFLNEMVGFTEVKYKNWGYL